MTSELPSLRRVCEITRGIEGWLSPSEGILLWHFSARSAGQGSVVEIGSYKGKSTIWLASGSKSARRERIVAVDPHAGIVSTYGEFLSNLRLAGLSEWVTPIVGTSRQAAQSWTGDLRVVFVDGSHEYKYVKEDFCRWFRLLRSGGIMALHDSYFSWEGPTKVVERILLRNPSATHVGFLGSITFCRKGNRSAFNQVRNMFLGLIVRFFPRIARLGRRRAAFWLGFILNATDIESIRIALWVYWQLIRIHLGRPKQA